jgi:Protein of unknown function (DUF2752)
MSLPDWLEKHALACPYKSLVGMDCPGCGMQRSIILMLRGEFWASLQMHPGTLPVLLTFVMLFLHLIFKFQKGAKILLWMYILTTAISITNYVVKQILLHS